MIGTVLLWITILVAVLGILQLVVSKNKKSSRIYWFILVPVFLTFGAFFLYLFLFLTHNFTFVNVFQNANLAMHPIQLVFCSWSGQSGSLFLWLLFTDITALIAWKDKKLWKETSIVLLLIHIILCILLLQSQPFATHNMMVSDGMGLNPVLSHPFMVLHPPFAFFAYSFLTLFMAKGFASLFHPSDTEWIYANRLYLYIGFFGLTITMILGSLWAYEIIGWGGYWSFDPVESGSLSLWFFVCGLIHLLRVHKKTGSLSFWYRFLPIFSVFSMFFVSFLIRSGLLQQFTAHAYAQGSLVAVLYFIVGLFLLLPLGIFFVKARQIGKQSTKQYSIPINSGTVFSFGCILLGFLLFLQVILPVFTILSFETISFIQSILVNNIMGIFVGLLLICILLNVTKKKLGTNELVGFLVVLAIMLFLYLQYPDLSIADSKTWIYFTSILVGLTWVVYWGLQLLQKRKFSYFVNIVLHVSLGLLIIGVVLSSALTKTKVVYLIPSQPTNVLDYSLTLSNNQVVKEKYLGAIIVKDVTLFYPSGNSATLSPSIWNYSRNYTHFSLPTPYIHTSVREDIQLIPFTESGFAVPLQGSVVHNGVTIEIIHFQTETVSNGFVQEKAEVVLTSSDNNIERFNFIRILHKNGKQMNTVSAYSTLLKEKIYWVDSEIEALVLSTDTREGENKYELVIKPGMFWIRTAYYLLAVGSFLLLALYFFFILKKRKKQVQCIYE